MSMETAFNPMMTFQSPSPSPQASKDNESNLKSVMLMSLLFTVLWILVGLAAFVMSLVCLGRSGSTAQHIIGILLAIFFGPFYWIYYFVAASYCRGPKKGKFMSR